MREQVADVGDKREMPRSPEAVGEGCGGRNADKRKGGVGEGDPAAGGLCFGVDPGVNFFGTGQGCGEQH